MAGLVPAIHVFIFKCKQGTDARHNRAFTPVVDGLWPGMTSGYTATEWRFWLAVR